MSIYLCASTMLHVLSDINCTSTKKYIFKYGISSDCGHNFLRSYITLSSFGGSSSEGPVFESCVGCCGVDICCKKYEDVIKLIVLYQWWCAKLTMVEYN